MKLLAWGVNHKSAPVELREKVAFHSSELPQALHQLSENGFEESMILSTCNRTEIYVSSKEEKNITDLRDFIIQSRQVKSQEVDLISKEYENIEVADHLFRVVASLDSMVIGEPEIVAQVKTAYQAAKEDGKVGKLLNNLIQRSFNVAKRIRTETELSAKPTSVGAVGANLAMQIFGTQDTHNILIMGAGEMAEVSLKNIMGQAEQVSIKVCNRSLENAEALAKEYGAEAVGLDNLEKVWCWADIVICSLGTMHEQLINKAFMKGVVRKRSDRPLFIIDLGVPRNVDPKIRVYEDVFLYDMDDLQRSADQNLKHRESLLESCEPYIQEGLEDFELWWRSLDNQVVISEIMKRNEVLIQEELQKSQKKLGDLNPEQIDELEYLLRRVLKKAMHPQIHSLRNKAHQTQHKMSWRDFFFGS
jgi:glutamyl-tRNA reductase